MALNWSSFLGDDGLNPQPDRWDQQPPQRPQAQQHHQQTLPQHPGRQHAQQPQITTSSAPAGQVSQAPAPQGPPDFSPYESGNQETYFSDAFYNDPNNYFLSDLEVLEPLGAVTLAGSTSDSSPENFNDVVDLTDPNGRMPQFPSSRSTNAMNPASAQANQSAASQQRQQAAQQQSQQQQQQKQPPNMPSTTSLAEIQQNFVTAFPQDPRSAAYVEDLTFPQGPRGAARNSVTTLDTVNEVPETDLTTKRNKNAGKADTISACWTSPLCPNHSKEGTPPNPSTCGGACAPFLFANTEESGPFTGSIDSSLLTQDAIPSKESPEGVVEIQSRPRLKRSESESSREPSGRLFSKSTSGTAEPQQQQQQQHQQSAMKNESSPDSHSPEDTGNAQGADAGDGKGKTRRRLPHNQVERKYRESLNTQLDSLRRVVPALQQSSRGCEGGDIEDLPTPSKPSKAVVLASATAYIKQMEKDKKQLADENQLLRTRIKALQALVKCEDCSLMQYVMDLKLHNGPPAPRGCPG
ncbi:putative transcription factor bhlh protein [Neofusicoccum parvum]|uniref:Transcription factor bhlh protein n=1 Tax=Neofusicoccum parvum TaxID=310453 RepID=A0ACB5RW81_9PEZI|nr:putative transcription factor bhlh protein [Neofusicoccum parvum]GME37497.1 putative transcription factor bhlh protein [Neofusicoccum parvum]